MMDVGRVGRMTIFRQRRENREALLIMQPSLFIRLYYGDGATWKISRQVESYPEICLLLRTRVEDIVVVTLS